jgi:hypothetical protein
VNRCDICDLDALLRQRSDELRSMLQGMNPTIDRDWERTFAVLADVDGTRRILSGNPESADA